jgi:hypothetical protein
MAQPDKLKEIMSRPQLAESGFFQRCLFVVSNAEPQEEPEIRPTISAMSAKFWNDSVKYLVATYHQRDGDPLVILPEEEASRVLRQYHTSLIAHRRTGGYLHDVDSYAARWGEQAWRLAVVLHAAGKREDSHKDRLSADTAENAVRLTKWFAANQLSLLAPARWELESQKLLKLLTILESCEGKCSTLRDLDRRHGIKGAQVEQLAMRNPKLILVENVKPPGAGRPSRVARRCSF